MAANANACVWGFWYYISHNPFKSVEAMTYDDLVSMRDLYIAANAELSTTASYTSVEYPGAITAAATAAAINQSNFPEKHKGS